MKNYLLTIFAIVMPFISSCSTKVFTATFSVVDSTYSVYGKNSSKQDISLDKIRLFLMFNNGEKEFPFQTIHIKDDWQDYQLIALPRAVIETINQPIVVGDRIDLSYNSSGKILRVNKIEKQSSVIATTVIEKKSAYNDSEKSLDEACTFLGIDSSLERDFLREVDVDYYFNYLQNLSILGENMLTANISNLYLDYYLNSILVSSKRLVGNYVITSPEGSIANYDTIRKGDNLFLLGKFGVNPSPNYDLLNTFMFNPYENFNSNILFTYEELLDGLTY